MGTTPPADLHLVAPNPGDHAFLEAMLVEAAFPPGTPRPANPLGDDHIARYLRHWGRPGDAGVVASVDGQPAGAAWTRCFSIDEPGYGFVDQGTPELTVAVADRWRGQGVGRALVVAALDRAAALGFERVSLSVAPHNAVAAALYRSLGFVDHGGVGGSITMVAPTVPSPPAVEVELVEVAARSATLADGPALLRLREVMFAAVDAGHDPSWQSPFLDHWTAGATEGRILGAVVDGPDGRPVASALATLWSANPSPGVPDGLDALIWSVATEPSWRGRGTATAAVAHLQRALIDAGVFTAHLEATDVAVGIYERLGFAHRPTTRMRWWAD